MNKTRLAACFPAYCFFKFLVISALLSSFSFPDYSLPIPGTYLFSWYKQKLIWYRQILPLNCLTPFIEMSLILYHELQFWILSLFFITNYATCYFHRAVIQEHIDQGNIYNTIDDNHFKSALNGWSCRKSSLQALCRYGAISSKKCKPSAGSPLSCI